MSASAARSLRARALIADLAALFEMRELARVRGTVDVGAMISKPRDITLDERELRNLDRGVPTALRAIFRSYYVDRMRPSPLPRRLARMKGEVDRHEELEHKLR